MKGKAYDCNFIHKIQLFFQCNDLLYTFSFNFNSTKNWTLGSVNTHDTKTIIPVTLNSSGSCAVSEENIIFLTFQRSKMTRWTTQVQQMMFQKGKKWKGLYTVSPQRTWKKIKIKKFQSQPKAVSLISDHFNPYASKAVDRNWEAILMKESDQRATYYMRILKEE